MKCGESSLEINFFQPHFLRRDFFFSLPNDHRMQMFRIDLQELIEVEKTLTTINRLQKQ